MSRNLEKWTTIERDGDREQLFALAERVDGLGCYITCPLCGDTDFDVPGFITHLFEWCEVSRAADMAKDNVEVAAALRAKASTPS